MQRTEDAPPLAPVHSSSEALCTQCGEFVQPNARNLHARYCSATVLRGTQAVERIESSDSFTTRRMHPEAGFDEATSRRVASRRLETDGGQSPHSRTTQRVGIAAIAGTVILLGGVFGYRGLSGSGEADIERAQEECLLATEDVLDDGSTLALDVTSRETSDIGPHVGTNLHDLSCALRALNTPVHVLKHIETTSTLDGQQSDEWGDLTARWRYSPDGSLQLVISAK